VANLLIIGGVLLLAYPISTWGYTWYEQRQLRQQLNEEHPELARAAAALDSRGMVQVTPGAGAGETSTTTTTTAGPGEPGAGEGGPGAGQPGQPQISPEEAQRLAQLAAFKLAADDFERLIGKSTGEPLGRIIIPSIGVDVVMIEGTGKGDLREGPGHWPETPFPGQGGNFVVSGHRTTYGAPFRKLNKVQIGDEIHLVFPYAIARYVVTKTMIVYPDEVESVAQAGKEQVSLAACHPIYSARQRIVVQGDLVAFKLIDE
jgi:LPXTG-site transpeptidase (sortase) family protein